MRMPVGTIALLSLAAVLYAAMMSCLADAPGGDAFGRGLALAYAAFIGAVLWIVLAALLVVAAVKGRMPVWAALALVVLLPLSCGAVWMASDAVGHGDASAFWVAALLPPLFALYALWARLPALHARLRAGVVSAVLGGAIVLLTAAPYVALTRAALPDPARDEAEFARLGPDSALESYLIYLHTETYGARARAGIGQLKNRQADAIGLLQKGRLLDLWDLRELDLSPTADL